MNTTNDSSENLEVPTDDIVCFLGFQLTSNDDLIFDAAWSSTENLGKLAQLIYLLQNSDLIMENIREMSTENAKDVEVLEKILEEINDKPVIYPSEVFGDE